MRAPKLLCVASAVDLDFRYGCTPAWWQLWQALNDEGAELVVAPYRGRPIETPWWRSAPNPAYLEGESYARVRGLAARLKGDGHLRRDEDSPDDSLGDRMTQGGDLARRDAALAAAPGAPRRARAARRRCRLHRPDGALPRHPRRAARPLRHPGRLLRRRRADEPARVRGHGHRLQLLPRRRSGRVRPRGLELRGRAREPAGARRPAGRGGLLGRRPRVLRPAARREGDRRLLLRLRRQVPPRVDGGPRRRALARASRRRLLARRPRLPRRHRCRAPRRRRAVPVVPARDLGGPDQPLHHPPLARDRVRAPRRAARSSSPRPAPRSSRTRTRGSSAGSSRGASCSS